MDAEEGQRGRRARFGGTERWPAAPGVDGGIWPRCQVKQRNPLAGHNIGQASGG